MWDNFARLTALLEVGLLPYSERLQILQLTTLAERHSRGDLIEVYKASKGLSQLTGVFNFSRSGLNLTCKPGKSKSAKYPFGISGLIVLEEILLMKG